MKLAVHFGLGVVSYTVNWNKKIEEFPHFIEYNKTRWSWVMYDADATRTVDFTLMYSEIPTYDPSFYATMTRWETILGMDPNLKCQCGKDKHGFAKHATWCDKWSND